MRLLLLFVAALLAAEPAGAQIGRTLRVVGVAANDVLNLRESPSAGSRIVGFVPPGARGVAVLGGERNGWIFVRWADVQGWALGGYLAEDSPMRRGPGGSDPSLHRTTGWWLVLGSFSDPVGTPGSIARVSEGAQRCGLRPFSATSDRFAEFTRGFSVVVVGPYPSRPAAEGAQEQVRACLPSSFVRFSRFDGG